TIKGYGIKATEENSAGGHGFPLANAAKIVDWIREIYRDAEPPAELLQWAESLHADWQRREEEKKAAAARSAPAPSAVPKDKVQSGLARAAIRAAVDGFPVFSISSDVQGSTGISPFQKTFPDRFVEVGIAEANMVSVGAGYAKMG